MTYTCAKKEAGLSPFIQHDFNNYNEQIDNKLKISKSYFYKNVQICNTQDL